MIKTGMNTRQKLKNQVCPLREDLLSIVASSEEESSKGSNNKS
jgi:hypothetical protein